MNPVTKKTILSSLFAAVVATSFAAPGFAAIIPAGVQLHATQTLIRNNGSEPETLDPALAESVGANNITRDLFEALTSNESTGKIVPGVAESWKQTDPVTWVFKLRPNAKWSNGDPVTAEDFVFGIRRFLDPNRFYLFFDLRRFSAEWRGHCQRYQAAHRCWHQSH